MASANLTSSKYRNRHGWSHHRICFVWHAMIARCHNPDSAGYKWYGARGIVVCERWRNSLQAFIDDMGLPPSDKHSIDRYPNNDGNYEPGNCRWATQAEQNRNCSRNTLLTFNGKTQCIADWADEYGIDYQLLFGRLRRGLSVEQALTKDFGVRTVLPLPDRIRRTVRNYRDAHGVWPTVHYIAKNTRCSSSAVMALIANDQTLLVIRGKRESARSTTVAIASDSRPSSDRDRFVRRR